MASSDQQNIDDMTPEQIEELLGSFSKRRIRFPGCNSSARSHPTRQEVRKYIEEGNEAKLLETLQKILNNRWYECLGASLADAINFFCERKNVERAKQLVALFKAECRTDFLDKYKTVKYIRLLIETGDFEEALVFLEGEEPLEHSEKGGIDRLIGTLIKVAQRTGDEDKISKLRALLEAKNYM